VVIHADLTDPVIVIPLPAPLFGQLELDDL